MISDAPHAWRKASYSGGQSNCVELHGGLDAVRDSKNPGGPVLTGDVSAFLSAIKAGRLGR